MPPRLLSLRSPAPDDHRVSALVVAGSGLHWLAPLGFRLTTDWRLAFTATMRMVARVHSRPADSWPAASVSIASRFSNYDVFVIDIPDLAKGRHAIEVDEPHLA
jgi:hypothetical protein